MNLQSTNGMIDSNNIREPATKFILKYMSDNPEWKREMIKINVHSHARAVYAVKNKLTKESVPLLVLSEILEGMLK